MFCAYSGLPFCRRRIVILAHVLFLSLTLCICSPFEHKRAFIYSKGSTCLPKSMFTSTFLCELSLFCRLLSTGGDDISSYDLSRAFASK